MFTHLLVPVDGTELSERAVQTSLGLASKLGARVTAFITEPAPPLLTQGATMASFEREAAADAERTEAHARAVLGGFAARAAAAGVPFQGEFVRTDAIDDAIARAAAEFGCDLIVMATHDRGAFSELLFGSHTKTVLRRTSVPLLLLH